METRRELNKFQGAIWQPSSMISCNKKLVYKPVKFRTASSIDTNYDNSNDDRISHDDYTYRLHLPKIQNPTITLLQNARG